VTPGGGAKNFDAGTAFDRTSVRPDRMEILIAALIWPRRGREHPISIAEIIQVSGVAGLTERTVKAVVAQLIETHRCRIGARRDEPSGYFWIVDADDQDAAVRPLKAQVRAELRRLRVLDSAEDYRTFMGQLVLEQ
jgi:hypothetical protein